MGKKNKRYTDSKIKKRDQDPFKNLNPGLNLKTRQEEIGVDYLHKLSNEEKEWLDKFNNEYVNASLDREHLENNIHNTLELKQSIDKRNNDRKECFYTREKAAGTLRYTNDLKGNVSKNNDYEDKLIEKLDKKKN